MQTALCCYFRAYEKPAPPDSAKLKGYDNLYRKDVGEFRIIYHFDNTHLFVSLVGKRNDDDIYKKLRN